jgi:hypothetical protein
MGTVKVKRVVIDTNVMISGLLFGGDPGKLIPLWQGKRIQPLVSKEMLEEYLRVLAYPKFKLSREDLDFILHHEILPCFEIVTARTGPVIVWHDPSDDKFIRCALSGKARIIISGDQHLIAIKSYGNIKIVTPAEFLQNLRGKPAGSKKSYSPK